MSRVITQVRPLLRIAIPIAVAATLIAVALINVFVVRNYQADVGAVQHIANLAKYVEGLRA